MTMWNNAVDSAEALKYTLSIQPISHKFTIRGGLAASRPLIHLVALQAPPCRIQGPIRQNLDPTTGEAAEVRS